MMLLLFVKKKHEMFFTIVHSTRFMFTSLNIYINYERNMTFSVLSRCTTSFFFFFVTSIEKKMVHCKSCNRYP